MSKGSIALIGAPVDGGAGMSGCIMGPAALRVANIGGALQDLGYTVVDWGDVTPEQVELKLGGATHHENEVAGFARSLYKTGVDAFSQGFLPIFLGGDHSLAMGTVTAAARHAAAKGKKLHVLWLDAHPDFNRTDTSHSGNMHGMSAAFFCGEAGFDGLLDVPIDPVDPRNFHVFGVRSIDQEEGELLRDRGVDVMDMRHIDEKGVASLIQSVLDAVKRDDAMLHVSLDVDFLDPFYAPGVGTTVPGGATYREAHLAMEMICDSGLMTSLDLVELNPYLDERGKSTRMLVNLTESGFGRRVFDRPTSAY